jgi:hypothetical protein
MIPLFVAIIIGHIMHTISIVVHCHCGDGGGDNRKEERERERDYFNLKKHMRCWGKNIHTYLPKVQHTN